MTRDQWQSQFSKLPPNLTLRQVGHHFKIPYRLAAKWARRLGYAERSGYDALWTAQRRRQFQRVPWTQVPWDLTNVEIARRFGVSREIVRRRRMEYGGNNK